MISGIPLQAYIPDYFGQAFKLKGFSRRRVAGFFCV